MSKEAKGNSAENFRIIEAVESKIDGVIVRQLIAHEDKRGSLAEIMKLVPEWNELFNETYPLAMNYASITMPGEMRDVDQWHHHDESLPSGGQEDRFVVFLGETILALYDDRENSPTHGKLEIIKLQGADWKTGRWEEKHPVMVLVPKGVKHCVANFSEKPCLHINFPTKIYDAIKEKEYKPWLEGRVNFNDVPIKSLGGRFFNWDLVKELLKNDPQNRKRKR